MNAKQISQTLRALADPDRAKKSLRFFKTGRGEYGEGDQFLGIRVPVLRQQAKLYAETSLAELQLLLASAFHEERLCALFILVRKFEKGGADERSEIYKFYLANTDHINNWDLVDSSAYQIVGVYLFDKDRAQLYSLCESSSLWERRIAIISTLYFIKEHQFDDTLAISERLLQDREDLIHKAVGWMIREVGNRDVKREKAFLKQHYQAMPRTMLRYAIEKFPVQERKKYLKGEV